LHLADFVGRIAVFQFVASKLQWYFFPHFFLDGEECTGSNITRWDKGIPQLPFSATVSLFLSPLPG
jgi:hypothetical protein